MIAIEMPRAHDSRWTAVTWERPAWASASEADDIWSNGAATPPPTTGRPRSESPALVSP